MALRNCIQKTKMIVIENEWIEVVCYSEIQM